MLSSSCLNYPFPNDFPVEGIPDDYINSHIRIISPGGWNKFIIGEPIAISIENISEEIIVFPGDFNIQSYSFSESGWVLHNKAFEYGLDGNRYLCPSLDGNRKTAAKAFYPIIELDETINLRIVITGHVFRDGKPTDILVGAFTDIRLKPPPDIKEY
jgi:hypothetical protein